MAPAKRALLIGSPFGGLRGTENDVNLMTKVLKSYGFKVEDDSYVKRLCDKEATRKNILNAWEGLNAETSPDDVVVIYYSGHGGLADSDTTDDALKQPSRIQFIVPFDFDPEYKTWRGIMDGEISLLLRKTTAKTQNVTYILDCCHSARNGRKLHGFSVQPKALSLSKSEHGRLVNVLEQLRKDGRLEEDHLGTNPYAVRIAAAAAAETAWEYQVNGHGPVGLMTKNLASTIMDAGGHRSWRDMMLEVGVLVEADCPGCGQHPRSAGPDYREPFSMNSKATDVFLARMTEESYTMIQGGRVNGIQQGDTYTIKPLGLQQLSGSTDKIATVTQVNTFAAILSPTPIPSEFGSSKAHIMALAVPHERQLRWPVSFSDDVEAGGAILDRSSFFRRCETNETPLVKFEKKGDMVLLTNSRGSQLASRKSDSQHALTWLLDDAKKFALAQHILSLQPGTDDEGLEKGIDIEFGLECGGNRKVLVHRGNCPQSVVSDSLVDITENDRFYVRLRNNSASNVYVNAFNVDATGKINLISKAWEMGLELPPGQTNFLAAKKYPFRGINMRWPESVPREGRVQERFVFVTTNEEIDLRDLDTAFSGYVKRGSDEAACRGGDVIPYDVEHIRYALRPASPP